MVHLHARRRRGVKGGHCWEDQVSTGQALELSFALANTRFDGYRQQADALIAESQKVFLSSSTVDVQRGPERV